MSGDQIKNNGSLVNCYQEDACWAFHFDARKVYFVFIETGLALEL